MAVRGKDTSKDFVEHLQANYYKTSSSALRALRKCDIPEERKMVLRAITRRYFGAPISPELPVKVPASLRTSPPRIHTGEESRQKNRLRNFLEWALQEGFTLQGLLEFVETLGYGNG